MRNNNREYFLSAVDPGGDTGLSLLHIQPNGYTLLDWKTVAYRPLESPPPTSTLIEWRLAYPGIHELVIEDFHLRNTSGAAGKDITALKVIGGIEQMMFDRDGYNDVIFQEPGQGKHDVEDKHLEALGLHMNHAHHNRHIRDSLRHSVSLLRKRGYLPVCRLAYPRGGLVTTR